MGDDDKDTCATLSWRMRIGDDDDDDDDGEEERRRR